MALAIIVGGVALFIGLNKGSTNEYEPAEIYSEVSEQEEIPVEEIAEATLAHNKQEIQITGNPVISEPVAKNSQSSNKHFERNPHLNKKLNYGTVTDIEGNEYATIKIGSQVWMAENLRTATYNDGTPIPQVRGDSEWENLSSGAWCYPNNNSKYDTPYGKLYNWYALGAGKLCPKGWHIPTDSEWDKLKSYLVSNSGGKMKATALWGYPNTGATNESGFSGLPGGLRGYDGTFYDVDGYWWSSTEYSAIFAWLRSLYYNYSNVYRS